MHGCINLQFLKVPPSCFVGVAVTSEPPGVVSSWQKTFGPDESGAVRIPELTLEYAQECQARSEPQPACLVTITLTLRSLELAQDAMPMAV